MVCREHFKKKGGGSGQKNTTKTIHMQPPICFLHINALMHTVNQLLWKNTLTKCIYVIPWNTRLIKSLILGEGQVLMNWRGACVLD